MPQLPGRIVAKEVRGVMLAIPSSVGMAVDGLHRLPLNGVLGEVLPEAAMGQALYSDAAAQIPDGQAPPPGRICCGPARRGMIFQHVMRSCSHRAVCTPLSETPGTSQALGSADVPLRPPMT
jgi:hypothetical protein